MSGTNRTGVVVQVVFAVATAAATGVVLFDPECVEGLLAEAARGTAGGLLFATVKAAMCIGRPAVAGNTARWAWYAWAVAKRDGLIAGLVAGYLLGVVIGIWHCFW